MKKALGTCIVIIILMSVTPILGETANYEKMDMVVREKVESGLSNIDVIIEFYELNDFSRALISKGKILNEFVELNSVHAVLNADELKIISSSPYVNKIWFNARRAYRF